MANNFIKVKQMNDGNITLEYQYGGTNSNSSWLKKDIINAKTNEMELFENIQVYADGNDVFIFPSSFNNVRKRNDDYLLSNWVFNDDPLFSAKYNTIKNTKLNSGLQSVENVRTTKTGAKIPVVGQNGLTSPNKVSSNPELDSLKKEIREKNAILQKTIKKEDELLSSLDDYHQYVMIEIKKLRTDMQFLSENVGFKTRK